MGERASIDDQIEALRTGRAVVRLPWRVLRVGGADAVGWLQDLLTADVAALVPGRARRSFLLGPTGRIRADMEVVRRDDDVVLLQDPTQDDDVADLLAPYTLSSDVDLESLTRQVEMLAIPGAEPGRRPTTIGPRVGALAPTGSTLDAVGGVLFDLELVEVSADAAERWRVDAGIPRMGPDFDTSSLPAETGLDDVVASDKGCFLGQESVARIRNLGHAPSVLRHVRSDDVLRAGDPVMSGEGRVGSVTSAATIEEGSVALARVSWHARTDDLTSARGRPVRDVPRSG